jgi:gliding motility-associated-like protein
LHEATWYDWEFTYSDGTVAVFTTTSPEIESSTNSVIGAAAVEVRVRGRNADVTGQYSPVVAVGIQSAPEPSVIEVVCNDVRVVHGDAGSWYKDGQKLNEIPNGEALVSDVDKGEYYMMNDNGCGVAVSNKVVFEPVILPNIVTPNGDEKNDTFIVDERLAESNLRIINRWGEQVFASPVYKNDWNGDELPAGVYFYTLRSSCLNEVIKGSVTIAR